MKLIVNFLGSLGIFGMCLLALLVPAVIIGWIMNIIDLCHMFSGSITPMFIARIAGIPVSPLGAVLGWFF